MKAEKANSPDEKEIAQEPLGRAKYALKYFASRNICFRIGFGQFGEGWRRLRRR